DVEQRVLAVEQVDAIEDRRRERMKVAIDIGGAGFPAERPPEKLARRGPVGGRSRQEIQRERVQPYPRHPAPEGEREPRAAADCERPAALRAPRPPGTRLAQVARGSASHATSPVSTV